MSLLKFFIRGPLPLNKIGLLGLLYAAKQTALKQNRDTLYILIRSDAHPHTYQSETGTVVPDPWHYTIDIKTQTMFEEKKHLTVHGYIGANPKTGSIANMMNVTTVVPKKGRDGTTIAQEENDEWFDRRRNKKINNWDANTNPLTEIDEPEELTGVYLGDDFITVLSKYEVDVNNQMQEQRKAEEEVQKAREKSEEDWQKLLPKE